MSEKEAKKKRSSIAVPVLCSVGCILLIYLCTLIGISGIPFGEANKILINELTGLELGGADFDPGFVSIIWNVRLPRVILAFLAGAALSVCGGSFQGIFRNPMADPYILGVSSGAAFGAAIGIVTNIGTGLFGMGSVALLAFAGALITIFIVYTISRNGHRVPTANLLLSGVAIGQTISAFMSFIMIFNIQNMNRILFWTLGSFNSSSWKQVIVVLPFVVIGSVVILISSRELDIMLLGEDTALELGVNTERLKRRILIASSVVVAAVVSVSGVIGFVGLVVPHIVRLVTGPKHKVFLPFSLIFGGAFLVLCDTLARSFSSTELPVGVITAAFGGPFFVYLLRKSRKGGRI